MSCTEFENQRKPWKWLTIREVTFSSGGFYVVKTVEILTATTFQGHDVRSKCHNHILITQRFSFL